MPGELLQAAYAPLGAKGNAAAAAAAAAADDDDDDDDNSTWESEDRFPPTPTQEEDA